MAKFYGIIGFIATTETSPGVYESDVITTHSYYGDVVRNTRRIENADRVNDDVNINNQISIVADEYAFQNIFAIRYAEWMGVKWRVTDVEVQRPRLVLTLGGVYNGQT